MTTDQTPLPVAPRWAMLTTGILCLFGLGVSIYLTIVHFVGVQLLVCADTGIVNCTKVTTSAQSELLGIPVAVLGLAYFVVACLFYSPWAWRSRNRRVHQARLTLSAVAMCFVLWLLAAEIIIIGSICLWCTSVHLVTFILFITTVALTPRLLDATSDQI